MKYTHEQFVQAVKDAHCRSKICELLCITATQSNYVTIDKRIKQFGLNIDHFDPYKNVRLAKVKQRHADEDVFIQNSTFPRHCLKKRIIDQNLIPYKCGCGNEGKWQDKNLVLQLDHINGVNNDNRLANLRFLCPNCHTQTATYVARNK